MAEYKLSFTGAEIDRELGQIDNLAKKSEVPTKTSQLFNDAGFITSYTETDPTVPNWAKRANKPTYTASEVGALPANTIIPDSLADLNDDINHRVVTDAEKETWNAKADISDIPTVPTNVSAFNNDAGYLTQHQSLDGYATEEYVNNKIAENSGSSESSDIFVVTIDYEHKTASHSASEIKAAYESGEIVVTMDSDGMLVPLFWVNEVEAIFHYIYDDNMLCSVDIIVGEDKQVRINYEEYSVKVPHFDFASMGMSPIPMPSGTVTFIHDMTDLIRALAKGAVSVRIPCSSGGTTIFYFDCHVMGHKKVGADCVQISVPAFVFSQAGESIANFLVTAIIYADRAIINTDAMMVGQPAVAELPDVEEAKF